MPRYHVHLALSAGMIASVAAAVLLPSSPQIGHFIALTSNLVWLWEAE